MCILWLGHGGFFRDFFFNQLGFSQGVMPLLNHFAFKSVYVKTKTNTQLFCLFTYIVTHPDLRLTRPSEQTRLCSNGLE